MSDRTRGIPSHCRCGERVRLLTSRTATNPGRLFYACQNGDEKNRYHLFKWTDESIVEEVEEMKTKCDELERTSITIEKEFQVSESEIKKLTMETRSCEAVVSRFEKELRGFEKEIEDCKMELRGLKNIKLPTIVTTKSGPFKYFFTAKRSK